MPMIATIDWQAIGVVVSLGLGELAGEWRIDDAEERRRECRVGK